MASLIGSGNVTNPMTSDLQANGFNISGGATVTSVRAETQTLAVPAGSGLLEVVCEDSLLIQGDNSLLFGAPSIGNTSISIQGDPGRDVVLGPIPAGAQANIIGYDTATNKLTFFATPGGGGGTVTGVAAGSNISVDNTNPVVPVVNLASPLTSQVSAAEQIVGGLSTDGTNTSEWEVQASSAGQLVAQSLTYGRDVGTGTEQSGLVELNANTANAELNTFWRDAPNTTTQSFLRSQAGQTSLNMSATGPLTQGAFSQTATSTGVNNIYSAFGSNITRISEAIGQSDARLAVSFQNPSFTFTTFNESVADASRARIRSVYTNSPSISHFQALDITPTQVQLAQSFANGATSRFNTLTTDATGFTIASDSALSLFSGGASNISITASGGAIGLTAGAGVNVNAGTSGGNALTTTFTTSGVGGGIHPMVRYENTNATGSVALEVYKNKPTAGANGDVLFTESVFGKDSANTKQEYTRITHTIRDATAGAEDGSMELGCFVNGGFTNFIQLNANDAPIGEINFTRPLDFIGGSDANATIKCSGTGSVNMNIDATASAGTGAIALKTKNGTAGSGAGLLLTGNTLTAVGSGGSAGQHLCLTINGVAYKIALLNP
jgi:hypothetical protein